MNKCPVCEACESPADAVVVRFDPELLHDFIDLLNWNDFRTRDGARMRFAAVNDGFEKKNLVEIQYTLEWPEPAEI